LLLREKKVVKQKDAGKKKNNGRASKGEKESGRLPSSEAKGRGKRICEIDSRELYEKRTLPFVHFGRV